MKQEMLMQKSIAERVRALREDLEISEEDMSKSVGVTLAEYREFENGNIDEGFTFLYKCATKLNVDISELATGDDPKLKFYNVIKKGEGMPIKRREGFDYLHIAPMLKNRFSEPFVVTAKYSQELEKQPIAMSTHKGQELNFVLSGALKVQLEDHVEILHEGESVYYDSRRKHGMIAIEGKDCVFLSVVIKGDDGAIEYNRAETHGEVKIDSRDLIYKKYAKEEFDEKGTLKKIDIAPPQDFNFAFDVVRELASKTPTKVAMQWLSHTHESKAFTFMDIEKYSNKAANYFKSLGIKKGDRVVLVLKRHYEFWFSIVALHKIGAVAIPATNLLTEKDFEYRFNKAGVSAVVCTGHGDVANQVDMCDRKCQTLKTKIIVNGVKDGWLDFGEGIEKQSDQFERPTGTAATKLTDPMLMYFTSGTTGYPKIATHDFSYPLGHIVTARHWHNVDPDGMHFTISDTGWGKAVWGKLYGQWLCEAGVFVYDFDKFVADDILNLFSEFKITTFCAPTTMYRMFIKEDMSKYDLSSLKYATVAGEAMNPEVFERFYQATGVKLMEGFGQTETTLTVANLVGTTPIPGSMGKPTPQYNVDILTPDGHEAKVGEVGEICIKVGKKPPCGLFVGYYLDKEKTNECLKNGIYHTGDMAWKDEFGYLWFVGRTDDIIKSSGYRIGPFEIESVIMELPFVLECAVTGAPDSVRGTVVKATVVLTKDAKPSDELKKEIQQYVKEHTAPYKYPRIVEFVDSLPKTISGKIRRVEIRDMK